MSSTRLARLLRLWVPVIAWMAAIFALSAQSTLPSMPDSALDAIFKKSGHALAYAILCFLASPCTQGGLLLGSELPLPS